MSYEKEVTNIELAKLLIEMDEKTGEHNILKNQDINPEEIQEENVLNKGWRVQSQYVFEKMGKEYVLHAFSGGEIAEIGPFFIPDKMFAKVVKGETDENDR